MIVAGRGGLRGTIESAGKPQPGGKGRITVRLDDGRLVVVPEGALSLANDGTYRLALALKDLEIVESHADGATAAEAAVIPVVREELEVAKRKVETGRVRVTKLVREHEEVVDIPLLREQVDIQRVPINRYLEGPAESRQEGDTLIIPLVEEVLVVEKRLMLKEELRITRRQVQESHPQRVTLRSEEAVVERAESDDAAFNKH